MICIVGEFCLTFVLQEVAMEACLNVEFLFKKKFAFKKFKHKINNIRYDCIHYTYPQRVHFPSYKNHRHLFLIQIAFCSSQGPNPRVLCGCCPQAYAYHHYCRWMNPNNPSLSRSTIDDFLEIPNTLPLNINYKTTYYPTEIKNNTSSVTSWILTIANSRLMGKRRAQWRTKEQSEAVRCL